MIGIVIGHSPKSPGRVTEYEKEYNLNVELGEAIHNECQRRGISSTVIHRLNGYNNLPRDINKINPDYTICVHHNGFHDESVNGTETLYYHKSQSSKELATHINSKMVECLKYRNRGTHGVDSEDRGGYVLKYTSMPCVLIEPYFMTNKEATLKRDPLKLARYIVDGYEEFLRGA